MISSIRARRKNFGSFVAIMKNFVAKAVNHTLWRPSLNEGSPASKSAGSRLPIPQKKEPVPRSSIT